MTTNESATTAPTPSPRTRRPRTVAAVIAAATIVTGAGFLGSQVSLAEPPVGDDTEQQGPVTDTERAEQRAERMAERMAERAERMAERQAERAEHLAEALAPLVDDGTLTEAQRDAVVAALQEAASERMAEGPPAGRGPGHRGGPGQHGGHGQHGGGQPTD